MFSPAVIDINHVIHADKTFMQAHTQARQDCSSWILRVAFTLREVIGAGTLRQTEDKMLLSQGKLV